MSGKKIKGFIELIDRYNEEVCKVVSISSQEEYRGYRRFAATFVASTFQKKDLPLKDVDNLLLVSFQQFMTDHYSTRTANRCQGFIKRVLASVNEEGILKGNMMTRKYYTTHESLTKEELLSVLRSRMPNERMQRVRDIFVLSCFTGLRLDDLRELTTDNFTVGRNGELSLQVTRRMTGQVSYIPLLNISRRILQKYIGRRQETLLPCITGEKTNYYLKEVGNACGLSKSLCFTMARNTFATTVTYENGLPIEIVSRTLGDNSNVSFEEMDSKEQDRIERGFALLDRHITNFTNVFVL